MGLRFSKRIKLVPSVQLNLSKHRIGVSVGGKGLQVSKGDTDTFQFHDEGYSA